VRGVVSDANSKSAAASLSALGDTIVIGSRTAQASTLARGSSRTAMTQFADSSDSD
jgi:hypothetical protein